MNKQDNGIWVDEETNKFLETNIMLWKHVFMIFMFLLIMSIVTYFKIGA